MVDDEGGKGVKKPKIDGIEWNIPILGGWDSSFFFLGEHYKS